MSNLFVLPLHNNYYEYSNIFKYKSAIHSESIKKQSEQQLERIWQQNIILHNNMFDIK